MTGVLEQFHSNVMLLNKFWNSISAMSYSADSLQSSPDDAYLSCAYHFVPSPYPVDYLRGVRCRLSWSELNNSKLILVVDSGMWSRP